MLDTNIASELIKTRSIDLRISRIPPGYIVISSVTAAELQYGLQKKPAGSALETLITAFLNSVEQMAFHKNEARVYGGLRCSYEKSGLSVGALDGLIAAHALATDCTLVTRDRALLRLGKWVEVEKW